MEQSDLEVADVLQSIEDQKERDHYAREEDREAWWDGREDEEDAEA